MIKIGYEIKQWMKPARDHVYCSLWC